MTQWWRDLWLYLSSNWRHNRKRTGYSKRYAIWNRNTNDNSGNGSSSYFLSPVRIGIA